MLLAAGCAALALMNTPASAQAPALLKRPIPRSGEMLPAVGVGTWQTFDVGPKAPERAELKEVLRLLVEGGGSVVDSSPMYGKAEGVVGDLSAELGLRERLFFATKVWTSGRDSGIRQMEDSFRLMRAGSRMDLMQVHNLVNVDVHLKTLHRWKAEGRIKYIGVTHYTTASYPDLMAIIAREKIDFVQFNYSAATREAEKKLLPLCADSGIAVIVNRAFEDGYLIKKMASKPVPAWASEFGARSWAQILLKYVLAHPAVTCVIPATGKVKNLVENVGAGIGPLPDAKQRQLIIAALA